MRWRAWLLVLVVTGAAEAGDGWPPGGWRFPTDADYKQHWAEYRDIFPVPFHVSGDFDGDGAVDHAWILIREGRDGFGLFVALGRRNGGPRVIEVFSYDECCAQRYALSLVPAGKHLTICGRGAECSPGEPKSVTLKHPGFEFITLGAASGLYYWSPRAKKFQSVQVAD
jgi:hypothetical protein